TALLDKVDDPVGDYPGLARASARKHEDRPILDLDGLYLLLIEAAGCRAMQHLFDQRLYCFELRGLGRPHHLEERHFQIGLNGASLSHPCQCYLFAFRLAGSDAVNQQVDLNVAGQQIQYRLRDANVSFDSTDDHLLYVLGIEPALEVPRSARTEAHFFYYRGI